MDRALLMKIRTKPHETKCGIENLPEIKLKDGIPKEYWTMIWEMNGEHEN